MASNPETPSDPETRARLKLRAEDTEDLAVIAAVLQDALVAVGEMAFIPAEGRFALAANRFRWECRRGDETGPFERIVTGISFETVRSVQTRGFRRSEGERILEILTVRQEENAILIEFSGNGCLRLEVESILCHLEDLGEPWQTQWRPHHPIDGG